MIVYHFWFYSLLATLFIVAAALIAHDGKTEIVIPHRVNENGDFISYKIPHHFKRNVHKNKINAKIVHYIVKIQDEDLHIELKPNVNLLSSGSIQEKYLGNGTNSQHANVTRFSDKQCQYQGYVKGKPNSSVALSNCAGLMGYINVNEKIFIIEPRQTVSDSDTGQPHLVYQLDFPSQEHRSNRSSRNAWSKSKRLRGERQKWSRNVDPGYMKQMYLETLVVLDKTLIDFHQSLDLDNYILTVLNMAHTQFRESSFGAPLELVLVRMISLEKEDDEMNLGVTKDAPRVLEVFQAWANRINPPHDSHPYHHDIAILITRVDICLRHDTASCGLLGLANLASACEPEQQALLVEDTGLSVGFTIAHEIGHALGMGHDGLDESGCDDTSNDGYSVLMSKQSSPRTRGWSRCSREFLWAYIDAGLAGCLYDAPADQAVAAAAEVLPGAAYGIAFQCRSLIDRTADACADVGVDCDNMKCRMPEYGCVSTRRPLAEGTACGEAAWCYGGRCLMAGQRPAARDGGWSEWGGWSACSRTCGGGVRSAARSCERPPPQHGGFYCRGRRLRYEVCNAQACPFDAPSYRDVQCAEFNDWPYPEDNQTHKWKSYIATSERPCALVCLSERQQLAVLRATAADGTPCYAGRLHMCVAGQCQVLFDYFESVGCDGRLESEAVEDACGVCRGGGVTCELRSGQVTLKKQSKPQLVLMVPVSTQFAVFEETSPTKANFYVRSGKTTVVSWNKFGTTRFKTMQIWLGYIRHQQELLRITGPTTEELQIIMDSSEEVTVKYSLGRASGRRAGAYSWQHVGWAECSAPCGPGLHNTLTQCVEATNGVVDNMHCPEKEKPKALTRVCEQRKCEARWQVGEWSGCDCACAEDAVDERAVNCARAGGAAGADHVVDDALCLTGGRWQVGEWSGCDCACAEDAVDERAVHCARAGGAAGADHVVDDALCLPPRPISEKPCKCLPIKRSGRTVKQENMTTRFKNTCKSVKDKFMKVSGVAKHKTHSIIKIKNKNTNAELTNIIDRDHLKNVQAIKQLKGKLIQDYDSVNDFQLTIEDDLISDKNAAGFPKHPKDNKKTIVHGAEAIKIILKVQESHHHTVYKPNQSVE